MDKKELKQIIQDNDLEDELVEKSMAMDESDQHSRELVLTIWNDGKASLSLRENGSDYPSETYNQIEEVIDLPRFLIYDDYDMKAALDNGIQEDNIEEEAIDNYKENFDLDRYLKYVNLEVD